MDGRLVILGLVLILALVCLVFGVLVISFTATQPGRDRPVAILLAVGFVLLAVLFVYYATR